MSNQPESNEMEQGPPAPRLVSGQIFPDEIEIGGLHYADAFKNVYEAYKDMSDLLLLECKAPVVTLYPIPDSCEHLFPPMWSAFEKDDRNYALFQKQKGQSLSEVRLNCEEQKVVTFLHGLTRDLLILDEAGFDLSRLAPGDIYPSQGRLVFLIFPREKTADNQITELLRGLVRHICYQTLDPKATRAQNQIGTEHESRHQSLGDRREPRMALRGGCLHDRLSTPRHNLQKGPSGSPVDR